MIAVATDDRLATYDDLLARYRAEPTTDGVVAAQNIAERLIADDVFGRLQRLRSVLAEVRATDESFGVAQYAIAALNDILGEG